MPAEFDIGSGRLVWKDIDPSDFSRFAKGLTILDLEPMPLGTPSSTIACGVVAICRTTAGGLLALSVVTDFSLANAIRFRTAEISTEYLERRNLLRLRHKDNSTHQPANKARSKKEHLAPHLQILTNNTTSESGSFIG